MKESQGDFQGAVNLYLKARLATKAARLAMEQPQISSNSDSVGRIVASLVQGEFYERVRALSASLTFASNVRQPLFLFCATSLSSSNFPLSSRLEIYTRRSGTTRGPWITTAKAAPSGKVSDGGGGIVAAPPCRPVPPANGSTGCRCVP